MRKTLSLFSLIFASNIFADEVIHSVDYYMQNPKNAREVVAWCHQYTPQTATEQLDCNDAAQAIANSTSGGGVYQGGTVSTGYDSYYGIAGQAHDPNASFSGQAPNSNNTTRYPTDNLK